jgi:hypothetical protein
MLADFGQEFIGQHLGVTIGSGVVFGTSIVGFRSPPAFLRKGVAPVSRVDEYPDRYGHCFLVDQIVEDNRHSKLSLGIDLGMAILKDHYGGLVL